MLFHLLNEFQVRVTEGLPVFDEEYPLEMVEALYNTAVDLFCEDEDYYRGCFLAENELHREGKAIADTLDGITKMLLAAVDKASAGKQLRGEMDPKIIFVELTSQYHDILDRWVHRWITLDQLRHQLLISAYLCFISDAKPAFRKHLIGKIDQCKKHAFPEIDLLIKHSRSNIYRVWATEAKAG